MQRALRTSLLALTSVAVFGAFTVRGLADLNTAQWISFGTGNWSDPSNWDINPDYPNNSGGQVYSAFIDRGAVVIDRDIVIQRLSLSYTFTTILEGASQLTLNDGLTWSGFNYIELSPGGAINLPPGSTSTLLFGGDHDLVSGIINNAGSFIQNGSLGGPVERSGIVNNIAGGAWRLSQHTFIGSFGVFNNAGTFTVESGAFADCVFNNSGTFVLELAEQLFRSFSLYHGGSASGSFSIPASAKFQISGAFHPGTVLYTLTSGAVITGEGSTNIDTTAHLHIAGNSTISTSLSLTNNALLTVASGATLSLTGDFTQSATTRLEGGTIASKQPLNLQSGSLTGSGTINGDLNNNGTISPGASAGMITINGSVSLLSSSNTVMEIGGLTQGTEYDYLAIAGTLVLGGTLEVRMLNGFESKLNPGQRFISITSKSLLGGVFANVANGARLTTADGLASFQVNYGAGSPYGADNIVLSDPLVVPEPATLVLFAGGAAALALVRYRKR